MDGLVNYAHDYDYDQWGCLRSCDVLLEQHLDRGAVVVGQQQQQQFSCNDSHHTVALQAYTAHPVQWCDGVTVANCHDELVKAYTAHPVC